MSMLRFGVSIAVIPLTTSLALGCGPDPELRQDLDSLRRVVDSLRISVLVIEAPQNRAPSVNLDPASDEGFSLIKTLYGPLTFKVEDVKPYADGSRVRLSVGNLSSADINGGKLAVTWGPRYDSEKQNFSEWSAALRKEDISFKTVLNAGVWNMVSLRLPGIPPDELGYIHIEISELPQILLRR